MRVEKEQARSANERTSGSDATSRLVLDYQSVSKSFLGVSADSSTNFAGRPSGPGSHFDSSSPSAQQSRNPPLANPSTVAIDGIAVWYP